jgi:hypothetical protein
MGLNIVGGKNFRHIVCDEGKYRPKSDLLVREIFGKFKSAPETFSVDCQRGILKFKPSGYF